MARPVETEPGNHGLAISTLVHDIQSQPLPEPDKNLGQAISGGIHGVPIPEPEFHFGQRSAPSCMRRRFPTPLRPAGQHLRPCAAFAVRGRSARHRRAAPVRFDGVSRGRWFDAAHSGAQQAQPRLNACEIRDGISA
jgi:hypothetical protein